MPGEKYLPRGNNSQVFARRKQFSPKKQLTNDSVIIPSQMEVAPLHCTVDITQKRRLFKNTKEIEKM